MVRYILLTGHNGFLGSVIRKELDKSFQVLTLGRNASCDYQVDFFNWDGFLELRHPIDAIVHVAGLAHGKATSNQQMKEVNSGSVDKLLSIAELFAIKTFVLISSVAVYGRSYGFNINESAVPASLSNYGTSKLMAEDSVRQWFSSNKNVSYINLRLPLVLGPNLTGNLGRLQNSISSGRHIYLAGNRTQKSIVLASDVALFILQWLSKSHKESGTINLCNQTAPTFNWVEDVLAEAGGYRYRFRIPIKFLWEAINWMKSKHNITIPFVGKLFYTLTFSDQLARERFGYVSKPLNQTTFLNELNSIN